MGAFPQIFSWKESTSVDHSGSNNLLKCCSDAREGRQKPIIFLFSCTPQYDAAIVTEQAGEGSAVSLNPLLQDTLVSERLLEMKDTERKFHFLPPPHPTGPANLFRSLRLPACLPLSTFYPLKHFVWHVLLGFGGDYLPVQFGGFLWWLRVAACSAWQLLAVTVTSSLVAFDSSTWPFCCVRSSSSVSL